MSRMSDDINVWLLRMAEYLNDDLVCWSCWCPTMASRPRRHGLDTHMRSLHCGFSSSAKTAVEWPSVSTDSQEHYVRLLFKSDVFMVTNFQARVHVTG